MERARSVEKLVQLLKKSPSGAVFNPWWQVDKQNDIGPNAPRVRRKQLRAYLRKRLGKTQLVFIGEALGYRGGHFSGIPMTSERTLLGKQPDIVAALCERRYLRGKGNHGGHRTPLQNFSGFKPCRTRKPSICPDGFSEPTGT